LTLTNDMTDIDRRVRIAAFNCLDEQVSIHGDVLPHSILSKGFEFENQRVPLVAPTGIFKPKKMGVKSAVDCFVLKRHMSRLLKL